MATSASMLEPAASVHTFATTHWSVILRARTQDKDDATVVAMEELCRGYWLPVYTYIRCRGAGDDEALDLTQSFFHRFLERHFLRQVDPGKGRFRSFMMVAINHYLANERDRERAVKRGGRMTFLPFDAGEGGTALQVAAQDATPQEAFERVWALAVLDRAWQRLRSEFAVTERRDQWPALAPYISAQEDAPEYAATAVRLGTTPGALKMTVRRLRDRYAELVRAEVAQTVNSAEEAEEELRFLRQVLAR